MWKLTIEDDEGKQTLLPLAQEEYGLGRGEPNAIRLTDRNVSRNHAVLKKNGQGWFLKDLQSYNGTYVNGVRVVGDQLVKTGDVVQLGDYRLELVDEATLPAPIPGAAPAPAPVHQRPNRLVIVVGPAPGTEFPLDKEHFTIGRAEEATISVNHTSVSRLHAELFALGNGRFEIVDKASANGIRINGVELKRGILEAGDALELGDVRMRFVGAGKIYRAAILEQTHQMAPFESVAPAVGGARPNGGIGVGKLVGLGAAVAIVAVALFVMLGRSGGTVVIDGRKVAVKADAPKQLTEALDLLGKKEYEAAHKKLLELPENSPSFDDAAAKEIEGAWADWIFGKVDQESASAEKKKLLKEITATPTVDAERRKKAADKLREVEAAEPPPPPPPQPVYNGPAPTGNADATAKPGPSVTVVAPLPAQGPPDEDAMRKQLEPKVWSGKASESEIKMLRAICSHLGNRSCRDRASAMLKKKQEGN